LLLRGVIAVVANAGAASVRLLPGELGVVNVLSAKLKSLAV
jgi:hypothetical protein